MPIAEQLCGVQLSSRCWRLGRWGPQPPEGCRPTSRDSPPGPATSREFSWGRTHPHDDSATPSSTRLARCRSRSRWQSTPCNCSSHLSLFSLTYLFSIWNRLLPLVFCLCACLGSGRRRSGAPSSPPPHPHPHSHPQPPTSSLLSLAAVTLSTSLSYSYIYIPYSLIGRSHALCFCSGLPPCQSCHYPPLFSLSLHHSRF